MVHTDLDRPLNMCTSLIREETFRGRPVYRLAFGDLEALVDSWHGMSVVSLLLQGRELLWYDESRYLAGNTYGITLLFPTPNRIRDDYFHFDGRVIGPSRMHGFAKDVRYNVEALDIGSSCVRIAGSFHLYERAPEFSEFPFPLEFIVSISISDGRIRWDYTVRNLGMTPLGYGFALHPFFARPQEASVRLNAEYVMEAGPDKLPTGALVPVVGTRFDLLSDRTVSDILGLDTVYYSPGQLACHVSFGSSGPAMDFPTSDDFRHFVVYAPEGASFFCVEPQTCSTDCHNLYDRGDREVSNLLLVVPGDERSGWVEIVFSGG